MGLTSKPINSKISDEPCPFCSKTLQSFLSPYVAIIQTCGQASENPFLQIKDNIGLGAPDNALDIDSIRQAARVGGAEEFIERLPDGFDTYLERPVSDQSSGLPSGTTTIFGKPVEHGRILNELDAYGQALSGGQMQRIAL